jgi:AcrR family transcriptional regulator
MVNKLKRRPSQKRRLIQAAVSVVAAEGVLALTIENVARAARVTKGGVQYHFQSKDALVVELLAFLADQVDAAIEAEVGAGASGAAWLRAYVRLSVGRARPADRVAAALLSSIPLGDERAKAFRAAMLRWKQRCEQGLNDRALAQLIRMAADSVWLENASGQLTVSERESLGRRLQDLVKGL